LAGSRWHAAVVITAVADPRSAVRAATEVAAEHGLVCTEPVVLSDGSNVVVHLAPTPVVARVATVTGLVRPGVADTMAKDLALAGYLAGRGAPVVAPSTELPTGPHLRNGYPVTFWTYVANGRNHTFLPPEIGPLLADLHAVLRDYPGEMPGVPPLDVPLITEYLRAAGLDGGLVTEDDLAGMLAAAARIEVEITTTADEHQALHGDAHPGNLMFTARGPMWTDFEDAWRGPIGWDLACLAMTGRMDGWAAVAGYPNAPDESALVSYLAGRRLQGLAWSLMFLHRFPNADRRQQATDRLRSWRESGW
jgi:hypothetical protein